MAVSGSIDWPIEECAVDYGEIISPTSRQIDRALRIAEQVWREFGEECLDAPDAEKRISEMGLGNRTSMRLKRGLISYRRHIHRAELLNLCQNIERGGKPELFYLASIKGSGRRFIEQVLRFNWELEQVWSLDVIADPDRHRTRRTMLLIPSPLGTGLRVRSDVAAVKVAMRAMMQIIRNNEYNPVFRAHMASILGFCYRVDPRKTKRAVASVLSRSELEQMSLEGKTLRAIHESI
jgi:hypothetical protein